MTDPRLDEPPRRGRVRAVISRSLVDARFAHPRTAVISLVALCAMIIGGMLMPVPYVVERPGPAIDVLGEFEDEQILAIDGAETHPTQGELMMTTVSVDGGPGFRVTPAEVLVSWFSPSDSVLPRELMFPEDQTREETELSNSVQMNTSQQGAVAVALEELDMEYEPTVMISGVQEGAPAQDTLRPGDVLLTIDGQGADDVRGYQQLVAGTPPGEPVPVRVRRDGQEVDLQVPTETVDGTPRMGVVLSPGFDFPLDVEIGVGEIGGPSAGMMFSLSVYDQLTPGALTGGHAIAGTGTISASGTVGPIGGIRQKLVGAQRSDAEYFLAPAANCDEVAGYEPDGMDVVAVSTFDDAVEAAETISETGSAETLPTCEDR